MRHLAVVLIAACGRDGANLIDGAADDGAADTPNVDASPDAPHAFTWGQPAMVGTGAMPQAAIDGAGIVIAAWTSAGTIQATRLVGSSWEVAVAINAGGAAGLPSIAANAGGTVAAVWPEGGTVVWGNIRPSAGPWGVATMIDPNMTAIGTTSVVVLSTGDVLAAWGEQNAYTIWASHVSGGVPTATRIDDPSTAGTPYNPHIAVDTADEAVAVWQDYPQYFGTHLHIWTNRFTPAAGWGTATAVDSVAQVGQFASDPEVAIDGTGNAIVVWDQVNTTTGYNDVWANRYVVGVGWGTAQDLGQGSQPRIAIDPAGDATVVSRGFGITAFRYVHGVGWGMPQPITTGGTNGNDPPYVAVSPLGDAVAVWEVFAPSQQIWANRYVPNVGWGSSTRIGLIGDLESYPVVVIDPMGNATALWQSGSTSSSIWANTMR